MSVSTVQIAMSRIHTAEERSPIAVFRTFERGKVNAVFANTAETRTRIERGDRKLVGVFHRFNNQEQVRQKLRLGSGRAITEDRA